MTKDVLERRDFHAQKHENVRSLFFQREVVLLLDLAWGAHSRCEIRCTLFSVRITKSKYFAVVVSFLRTVLMVVTYMGKF